MVYVLLAIIGIPILCVIGYGAIDALIINMHKKAQNRRHKREMDNYCREKERKRVPPLIKLTN